MTSKQRQFFSALPHSWQEPLRGVCQRLEIEQLIVYLKEREVSGVTIFPSKRDIFAALSATPFDAVSVIIVGQDPYHGHGQAHGLSFSVPPGVPVPPSLHNIFKELHHDLGMQRPTTGTLFGWAQQGVLLLNAILTVEQGSPASHANRGWELFTDAVIEQVLKRGHPTVLMLWGSYAQKKVERLRVHLNTERHLVLTAGHPSPLSATRFFGCSHFSLANSFLEKHHLRPIDWGAL